MKKTTLICFISFFILTHSKAQSRKDYPAYDKTIDSIRSSLLKQNVDTILVFTKECHQCLAENYPKYTMNAQDGSTSIQDSAQLRQIYLPAYIMWVKNKHFYIKKVDRQGIYKTIERKRWQEFPIYDYAFRNKDSIKMHGMLLHTSQLTKNSRTDLTYEYTIETTNPYTESDHTLIKLSIDTTDLVKIDFRNDFYLPVAETEDAMGNSESTYYYNMMLERTQWKRIIESELFEIESNHLWQKEKEK